MKIWKSEDDLREWLRGHRAPALVLWAEAARGSTHGHPDATVVEEGGAVTFIELKVGSIVNGLVQFDMNNTQRICLRKLHEAGATAVVVVGEEGGSRLWMAHADKIVPKIGRDTDKIRGRIPHVITGELELDQGGGLT